MDIFRDGEQVQNATQLRGLPIGSLAGIDTKNVLAWDSGAGEFVAADAEAYHVHVRCRKGSVGTINKGQVVYISGWNPAGYLEVELADASDPNKMPALGIAEESIGVGADGFVIQFGALTGLNTGGLGVGSPLYVSPTTPGAYQVARPTSPSHLVQRIGLVVRDNATVGVATVIGAGRTNDVPNRSRVFVPEFAGAVISRPGSNPAVDFSGGHDATNRRNYYRGEAVNATLQSSSIFLQFQLPEQWPGWFTTALKYWNRVDATPGSTGLTVKVYDTTGTLDHTDTKQANTSWTETSIADTDLTGTYTAGGIVTVEFLFEAQNGKGAELGPVTAAPAGD